MTDTLLRLVEDLTASPWIYVVVLLLSAVDGFFPVVPSESVVITAAVFSASTGSPNILLVVVAAAVGAFVGDHVSYNLGRLAGPRLRQRADPGSRKRRTLDATSRLLESRGGQAIIVARYIPGGRTAVTATAGAVGYPQRRFSAFDAVAAVSWAVYSAVVGYVGGRAFEDNPLLGLLLGLGIAVGVTALIELGRFVVRRRRAA